MRRVLAALGNNAVAIGGVCGNQFEGGPTMLRLRVRQTIQIAVPAACAILVSTCGLMAQTLPSADLPPVHTPEFYLSQRSGTTDEAPAFFLAQLSDTADDTLPPIVPGATPPEADAEPPETPEAPDEETPPPPLRTPLASLTERPGLGMLAARTPALRLASVPNMLGDYFSSTAQLQYTYPGPCEDCTIDSVVSAPLAAGGRRLKISENNKALPMDRVYFMFHHFHNAIDINPNTNFPFGGTSSPINRYTIGLEKTFLQGRWSVDLRLPFSEKYRADADQLRMQGDSMGDFALVVKRLLWSRETSAAAIGLGIDTPTGSDVGGFLFDNPFVFKNEAMHFSPFVGILLAPTDMCYFQMFLEVDVPTSGNEFEMFDPIDNRIESQGKLDDQTLFQLDATAGWWFYRDPGGCGLTGLGSIFEFHYTTTVDDADVLDVPVNVSDPNVADGSLRFGNLLNRLDVVNFAAGLHALIHENTTLRVACVFPAYSRYDNPFDAEVHFSVNRYY
jgi:hypothetical protein